MPDLKLLTKEMLDDSKNWNFEKIKEYDNIRAILMIVEMYNMTRDDNNNITSDGATTTAILSNNIPNLTELASILKQHKLIALDPYMIFVTTVEFIKLSVEIINNIETIFNSKKSEYDQKEFNKQLNRFKKNIINNYRKMVNNPDIIEKIHFLNKKVIEIFENNLEIDEKIEEKTDEIHERIIIGLDKLMQLRTSFTTQLIRQSISDIFNTVKKHQ